MLADVIVIDHADGSLIRKLLGPAQPPLKTVVENEQLAALMQSGAGLNQCAGGFAGLDNDRRFGERRHRNVALGEE